MEFGQIWSSLLDITVGIVFFCLFLINWSVDHIHSAAILLLHHSQDGKRVERNLQTKKTAKVQYKQNKVKNITIMFLTLFCLSCTLHR